MFNHLPRDGDGFEVVRRPGLPRSREAHYAELLALGLSPSEVEGLRAIDERQRARFVVEAREAIRSVVGE